MLNCPDCGNEIIKNYPNGKTKLRTNIVIWEEGRAICKCTKCHRDVKIPVKLERSIDNGWKKWESRVNGKRTIYRKEKPKAHVSRMRSTESSK